MRALQWKWKSFYISRAKHNIKAALENVWKSVCAYNERKAWPIMQWHHPFGLCIRTTVVRRISVYNQKRHIYIRTQNLCMCYVSSLYLNASAFDWLPLRVATLETPSTIFSVSHLSLVSGHFSRQSRIYYPRSITACCVPRVLGHKFFVKFPLRNVIHFG